MRKLFALAILTTLVGIAGADDKKAPPAPPPEKPAKVKVYDFAADSIEGEVVKPEGSGIAIIGFGHSGSLIRIRKEFTAEIIKSGEDI